MAHSVIGAPGSFHCSHCSSCLRQRELGRILAGRMGKVPNISPRSRRISLIILANAMGDPLVSIIMRSFNEGWALRETLPALQTQHYRNWELIVIDSGSTDDSVELFRRAQPRHFIQIQPHEYNPSRVLNCGMDLARSQFGIFLNADATPQ